MNAASLDDYMREIEARIILAKAEAWRAANPDAWREMAQAATNEAAHNRRFSVKWLFERMRRTERVDRMGEPFRYPNEYTPIVARWLALEFPEVKPYITMRASRFDSIMDGNAAGGAGNG